MTRVQLSLGLGALAGLLDVLPMIPLQTSALAMASAFTHWLVLGFVIVHVELRCAPWLKGLALALASAVPVALMVVETDPHAILPITATSVILGSAVGYVSGRLQPARAAASEIGRQT